MSHIRNPARPPFPSSDVSHPESCPAAIPFSGCLTSGILTSRHSTFSGCLTSGILPRRHFLLRMSHIRNHVRPTFHLLRIFHIRRLTSDGRGAIQLPLSDMFGSSDSAYPESIRSRQFRFPGQLGSSDTRDSSNPFPPTIKKQTPIILTTKSPELSLSLCFILICFSYE